MKEHRSDTGEERAACADGGGCESGEGVESCGSPERHESGADGENCGNCADGGNRESRGECVMPFQAADVPDPESGPDAAFAEAQAQTVKKRYLREGFLYGVIAALMVIWAVTAGRTLAERLLQNSADSGSPGAEVLTDDSTISKLEEVQEIIGDSYLGEVDGEQLAAYMFKGIAAGLDDAYADYYTEEELSSVLDSTRGSYYGIGATIQADTESGDFVIVQVYDGGPAQEGGLKAGDIVRQVNGESVEGMDLSGLVALIKSETETFTMTVYRSSLDTELDLEITCSDVTPAYVTYEMLDGQIGYIKLTEFTESAVEQFCDAAENLNSAGMEKLIVDVRDNPGGLLSSVCDILDEILPEGLMVYTEDKNGNREEYEADDERIVTCEVAVLVNGGSASASEIFAGAVQDYGLGPVIGTQTYGKGIVQKTYPLSDGSAFKLTVENYYTPNGQNINGSGITPDIVVADEEEQTEEAQSEASGTEGQTEEAQSEASGTEGQTEEAQSETSGTEGQTEEVQSEASGTEAQTDAAQSTADVQSDPVLRRAVEELLK